MNGLKNNSLLQNWIILPLNKFILKSTTAGFILFFSAFLALILANSPLKEYYFGFWEQKISFSFNDYVLSKSIHHWINDGLMTIFFFVVGLELKREIIAGELTDSKNIVLPIVAGVGGMVFPALIYLAFNPSGEASNGWGIPMATDIAFALGVLYLLGKRIPTSLKIFLTVLAIADDIGAVLVIAFFYTSKISFESLFFAFIFLIAMFIGNRLKIRNVYFYAILGILGVWFSISLSGVHATIGGILAAFTIPSEIKIKHKTYYNKINKFNSKIKELKDINSSIVNFSQFHLLEQIKDLTDQTISPLQKIEHHLNKVVTYFVLPLFAFSNSGVTFIEENNYSEINYVTVGIFFGLILGKVIGVFGVSLLMIKLGFVKKSNEITFKHLLGVGFLAGIGFTMSLFVTNLAFQTPEYINHAKIGILSASVISGLIGYLILSFGKSNKYEQVKIIST
ncbi:MAG: Na+/H+ antiporter NhaA [Flavobacteriales bacterium]|nr:Na+/H+ antiporter NhaA [Flavobacteriales bacterium]